MKLSWLMTGLAFLCLTWSSACAHAPGGEPETGQPKGAAADALEDDPILHSFDPPAEKAARSGDETDEPPAAVEGAADEGAEAEGREELDKKEETEDLILSTVESRDRPEEAAPEARNAGEPAEQANEVVREDPILDVLEAPPDGSDPRAEKARKKAEKKKRKAEKKARKLERKHRENDQDAKEEEKKDPGYEDDIRG